MLAGKEGVRHEIFSESLELGFGGEKVGSRFFEGFLDEGRGEFLSDCDKEEGGGRRKSLEECRQRLQECCRIF